MQINTSDGAGYVHGTQSGQLADMAAEYAKRTGCTPVFLISQEVVQDPQAELKTLGSHLYSKGITRDNCIHTFSLLVLLSSGQPPQEMLQRILLEAKENDGIVFVEDTYRFHFNRRRASELLDSLVQIYRTPGARCPLVLKAPPYSDRQLFSVVDSLRNHCFHLGPEPMIREDCRNYRPAGALYRPQSERDINYFDRASQTVQDIEDNLRNAANKLRDRGPLPVFRNRKASVPPDRNSQVPPAVPRNDPEPGQTQMNPTRSAQPQENVSPQDRVVAEYRGLQQYLNSRNFRYELSKPGIMAQTRRSCIQLRLPFQELGMCVLSIVYDYGFPQREQTRAAVAISGAKPEQMRKRLYGVKAVFDREIGGWLFSPPANSQILQDFGTAAAVVEGLIRAMI